MLIQKRPKRKQLPPVQSNKIVKYLLIQNHDNKDEKSAYLVTNHIEEKQTIEVVNEPNEAEPSDLPDLFPFPILPHQEQGLPNNYLFHLTPAKTIRKPISAIRKHPRRVAGKIFKDFPSILAQFDEKRNGLSKSQVGDITAGSRKSFYWLCPNYNCTKKCLHSWRAPLAGRTRTDSGCLYCMKRKICPCNSFGALYPDILKEWNYQRNTGIDPYKLVPCTAKKVWWKCNKATNECGCTHEWETSLHKRISAGRNCPFCSHNQLDIHNSIVHRCPEILVDWSPPKLPKAGNYSSFLRLSCYI